MLRYLTALFFGIFGVVSILWFFAVIDADVWAARERIDTAYHSEFFDKMPLWLQRHNKKLYISQEPVSEPIYESRLEATFSAGYKKMKELFGINSLQEKIMQKHCDSCQAYQELKLEEEYLRKELRRVKQLFNRYIDRTKYIMELNKVLGPEYQDTLDKLAILRREYKKTISSFDDFKESNVQLSDKNKYLEESLNKLVEREEQLLELNKKYVEDKDKMQVQYEEMLDKVNKEDGRRRNYMPICILTLVIGFIVYLGIRFIVYDVLGIEQAGRIYVKIRDLVWLVFVKLLEYSFITRLKDLPVIKKVLEWFKGPSGV